MKQTAVEWIEGYLKKFNHIEESLSLKKAFEQAKQMEKEQIKNSFSNGFSEGVVFGASTQYKYQTSEQYYNETFKSE
jgi:hypothetical protein